MYNIFEQLILYYKENVLCINNGITIENISDNVVVKIDNLKCNEKQYDLLFKMYSVMGECEVGFTPTVLNDEKM